MVEHLHPSMGWIVWNKDNGNCDQSDCEIAFSSFKKGLRMFTFRWHGLLQENMKNKEIRIHPTQKPVALYTWLLDRYATKGDKILDTHLGSGSIAIACYDCGYDLTACELDKEYFEAFNKRFKEHKKHIKLF